nr:MAG TPA: Radical SAM superfamily [Caudoviricetes sp.]
MISYTFPTSLLFLLVFCAVCAVKCTFCFFRFPEHFPPQIPKSLKDRKNPVISDGI